MTYKKDKMTRTVSDKIRMAANGHLGCQFEVAEWYRDGKYSLDVDLLKYDAYINHVKEALPKKRPYFKSLEILNFKGIRRTQSRIDLDPHLNVFVGVNGCGKTTILDALAKVSSWIVNGIRSKSNGRGLEDFELNHHHSTRSAAIIAALSLDGDTDFVIELCKNKSSTSKVRSSLAEIKNLAEMYYYYLNSVENSSVNLPLFAFYSVGRALDVKGEDVKKEDELKVYKVLDGYLDSFEDSKNFKHLLHWIVFMSQRDGVSLASEINSDYRSVKAVNDSLKSLYSDLPDELIDSKLARDLLEKIEKNERFILDFDIQKSRNDHWLILVVKDAIYKFMNIQNIRMEIINNSVSILMEKNGVTISSTDLSQGERALFSLVSDIARRLVILNPGYQDNALNGFGVVMIDEIDLHLHPQWQQEIVHKLRAVFPNIQFILTTHSPQVLSTVPHSSIKVIDNGDDDYTRVTEPEFSLGAESKMLLESIMLVDSRPQNTDIVKKLNKYVSLVSEDKWETPEAIALFTELESWGKGYEPQINKLRMDVKLRKSRRGQ